MQRNPITAISLLTLALTVPAAATAEDLVPDAPPESAKEDDGLDWVVSPGFSFSFTDNRKVIGQPEGSTVTLAVNLASGLKYRTGDHELRLDLAINEAFSRTPVLEEFIKSTDELKFEAMYLYYILDWLGVFGRFSLQTAIFESFTVHPDTVAFNITELDGDTETRLGRRLRLTDGWQPLTLRESVGLFASPYTSDPFNVEFRAGFGGLHTLAKGNYAVSGADGDQIAITALDDFNAAAVETAATLWGEFYEKKLLWKAGAEFLVPVVNDDEAERDPGELTNMELYANLSFKLLSWLSLDYQFKAVKQPQLLDDWQIQNNLLLTAAYTWSSADEN